MKKGRLFVAACISAAVAIGAGAFGAHVAMGEAAEWLRTGAFYQLVHAVAICALSHRKPAGLLMLLAGSLIFSASLYALALGAPRWFGAVAPVGGTLMIIGWLWLAVREFRTRL